MGFNKIGMAKVKISKRDQYIEIVKKFAAYVDSEEDVAGVYATIDDARIANSSLALKKLRNTFKFKVQMVIK